MTRFVIAVSGGLDSMALLHMVAGSGYDIVAVYCNHGLRSDGEIAADIDCIEQIATRNSVPVVVEKIDVAGYADQRGCGLEMAGRILRYRVLGQIAKQHGATAVLTAHHQDDGVESILLKWIRGAGLGMAPMAPIVQVEGALVWRPLLGVTKATLCAYCEHHRIRFNEDLSNGDLRFVRNRIRQVVLPALRGVNPQVDDAILQGATRTAELVDHARKTIPMAIASAASTGVILDSVRQLPPVLQSIVGYDSLIALGIPPRRAGLLRLLELLATEQTGKQAPIDDHWHGVRTREGVRLIHRARVVRPGEGGYDLPIQAVPADICIPGTDWVVQIRWIGDESDIPGFPVPDPGALRLRSRRSGDRFHPKGFPRETSLKRFLIGQKIPIACRDRLPLFFIADQLVWVGFVRGAEGATTVVGKRLHLSVLGEL